MREVDDAVGDLAVDQVLLLGGAWAGPVASAILREPVIREIPGVFPPEDLRHRGDGRDRVNI